MFSVFYFTFRNADFLGNNAALSSSLCSLTLPYEVEFHAPISITHYGECYQYATVSVSRAYQTTRLQATAGHPFLLSGSELVKCRT
jgi:hypothetical protein